MRLVAGIVNLVGSDNIQITVRENLGPRVTVRGEDGKEKVRACECI